MLPMLVGGRRGADFNGPADGECCGGHKNAAQEDWMVMWQVGYVTDCV
jgi:hypothetical protein